MDVPDTVSAIYKDQVRDLGFHSAGTLRVQPVGLAAATELFHRQPELASMNAEGLSAFLVSFVHRQLDLPLFLISHRYRIRLRSASKCFEVRGAAIFLPERCGDCRACH